MRLYSLSLTTLLDVPLLSDNSGWASYPVMVKGTLIKERLPRIVGGDHILVDLSLFSGLARQLIQEQFKRDFAGAKHVAVDQVMNGWELRRDRSHSHSQRSTAKILAKLDVTQDELPIRLD